LVGNEVELVKPLWNLCDYFVPVWPYIVIYSKYNLNGVVLTYNFNFGRYELINLGSRIGSFLLTALCLIFSIITFTYHLFTALAEYQSQVYSTLVFSPATESYYLAGEDGLEFFDEEF
jgi:hypothetical protein